MAHQREFTHRCPCNCLLLEPGCEQINAQMKLSITSQPPTIVLSVRFYLVLPVALENIVLNSRAEKYLHHSPLQRPPLVNKSYLTQVSKHAEETHILKPLCVFCRPARLDFVSRLLSREVFWIQRSEKGASNQSSFLVTSLVAHLPYMGSILSCVFLEGVCLCGMA